MVAGGFAERCELAGPRAAIFAACGFGGAAGFVGAADLPDAARFGDLADSGEPLKIFDSQLAWPASTGSSTKAANAAMMVRRRVKANMRY